jgi:hypothetical protein
MEMQKTNEVVSGLPAIFVPKDLGFDCTRSEGFPMDSVEAVRWPMVKKARFRNADLMIPLGRPLAAKRKDRVKPANRTAMGPSSISAVAFDAS